MYGDKYILGEDSTPLIKFLDRYDISNVDHLNNYFVSAMPEEKEILKLLIKKTDPDECSGWPEWLNQTKIFDDRAIKWAKWQHN